MRHLTFKAAAARVTYGRDAVISLSQLEPVLPFSQPANSKVVGSMRASIKGQEVRGTNGINHDVRVLVISDVVNPETKCQELIPENETALQVHIELKERGKATGVYLSDYAAFRTLNRKWESGMLLHQISDSPFFPECREIAPTQEAIGSVPGHRAHIVGDEERIFNIDV